jgi:hypothetical protein
MEVKTMYGFWWSAPRIVSLDEEEQRRGAPDLPWWAALAFAVSCIALGIALVVWPPLLAVLVAWSLIAAGTLMLPVAVQGAWSAWRRRPRRIRVRYGRGRA